MWGSNLPPPALCHIAYPEVGGSKNLQTTPQGTLTPVTWVLAPDRPTVEEACKLSGWDAVSMAEIILEGGVDLDDEGLIFEDSLWELQETLAEVVHWND